MSDKPTWSDLNPDSDAVVKPTGHPPHEPLGAWMDKPTGEWTREDVYNHTVDDIVAAHNAALAAERVKWNDALEANRQTEKLLAAEREKQPKHGNIAWQEVQQLREQLEHERICHSACGVIAMSNTRESLAKNRVMNPEYLSASVQDCIKAIEREIKLREQLAAELTHCAEKDDQLAAEREKKGK